MKVEFDFKFRQTRHNFDPLGWSAVVTAADVSRRRPLSVWIRLMLSRFPLSHQRSRSDGDQSHVRRRKRQSEATTNESAHEMCQCLVWVHGHASALSGLYQLKPITPGPHRTRQRCFGPVCDRPSVSRTAPSRQNRLQPDQGQKSGPFLHYFEFGNFVL